METTIVVADSRRLIREGIVALLAGRPDFKVVAQAADGRQALEQIVELSPTVTIVDAQLPRLAGIEVVRRVREAKLPTRCVVVSSHASPSQVREALSAGACGFLPSDASSRDLLEAVSTVASGHSFLSAVSDQVASALVAPEHSSGQGAELTARQREILQLISEGLSTKEIAVELGISAKTVETHRARLMHRLRIRKASSLVRYAIREGIVSA